MESNYVQLFLELLLLSLVASSGDLHAGVAWCAVVCWPRIQLVFGTKFALLGLLVTKTVESSPCTRKTRRKEPFRASRASFIPHMR